MGDRPQVVGGTARDFCMPLSDLGKPDQDVADYWVESLGRDDPGMAKWIVQPGPGPCLSPHELHQFYFGGDDKRVEVHFTGKTLDGAIFVTSRENGTPMTFMLTQENVIEGFIEAISTMQPGEKAVFTIDPDFAVTESGCPASIPWNIPPNQTLRFDVELISLITDVLEDQCILKKTIKLGSGKKDHPGDLDEVFVKYTVFLEDGTSVSTSEGVEFSLAEGFYCPAFAHALKTMAEGEGALLIINPKYGFGEQGRPAMGNEAPVPPDAILHVNLQLMSWITVSRVGEHEEILKRAPYQNKFSRGQQAMNEAAVKVRMIGKLEDGTVFDKRGHDGDKPFEFTIDEEHVIHSLDEAVLTMKEGEVASFTIPPQHAFGTVKSELFQLATVPANSTVIYEIELLAVVNKEIPFMNEECIKFGHRMEKEGDNLFILGKYMRAYRRYYRASRVLQWTSAFSARDAEIAQIIILCLLKSAECAVQVQRYEQAADRYREVLEYDRENAEAQKVMAQSFPKASLGIDTVSMHMGLDIEEPGIFVHTTVSSMRVRKVRGTGKRTRFFAPPVDDESQPTSTGPAESASGAGGRTMLVPRDAQPAENDAAEPVPAAPAAPARAKESG